MTEGFKSRAIRLSITYRSQTVSYNSYISLPIDFWEGAGFKFEQLGVSAIPVDRSLCWSLAPTMDDTKERDQESLNIEGLSLDDENGNSDYVPFVVGTSVVASGVIQLGLVDPTTYGRKNTVKVLQPKDQEPGTLRIIYDFRPEGNAVLIPAIPSILTPADFLAFLRDASGIVDIRLVREATPGKFMALIRLNSQRNATRFAEQYSGKRFSALEMAVCQVLWMAEIEFVTRVRSIVPLFDPADFKDNVQLLEDASFVSEFIEIPSCPVCLDRLDSTVTGIITTICSHSYHCECMLKWHDGSCPVCRFLLSEEDEKDGTVCGDCGCRENLWICLICGNVGCGRYRSRHAQSHFESTGHTFSLEIESQRVWDYVGDNYVHRLVQNHDDGKLVEISNPPSPIEVSPNLKKNDDPDYISSLLIAQLESQRIFYEDKLSTLELNWSIQSKNNQAESFQLIEDLKDSIKALEISQDKVLTSLYNQLHSLEDRIEVLKEEKSELHQKLAAESAMLEQVLKHQSTLEETILEKDKEIADLQDQINDLLMHIEGQKAIDGSSLARDLRAGHIQLVEQPKRSPQKKSHRKR